jgi:hypothetical protein
MRENGSAATCAANSAMRAIDCDQIATPELAASGECTCASELFQVPIILSQRHLPCAARGFPVKCARANGE